MLLERGLKSEAVRLPCFQKLIDIPDAVTNDTFQWTRGDQCMLGQKDVDSGLSFHASTAWGTTSTRIRSALSIGCDDTHEHQRIEGSNNQGLRSAQKAEWPAPACREVFKAMIKELEDRACQTGLPA